MEEFCTQPVSGNELSFFEVGERFAELVPELFSYPKVGLNFTEFIARFTSVGIGKADGVGVMLISACASMPKVGEGDTAFSGGARSINLV